VAHFEECDKLWFVDTGSGNGVVVEGFALVVGFDF